MDATEAFEEIKRDLCEMGIEVKPNSMQDKDIKGDPNYYTKELQNYSYCILESKPDEIQGVSQPWADAEFEERITEPLEEVDCRICPRVIDICGPDSICPKSYINPGEAYKLRPNVWNEFLRDGKFGYTYNERIWANDQLTKIIERIKVDPFSRQLYLSLWNPDIDPSNIGGAIRVPCSLGYNFQVRGGKLNIHYMMRSSDFTTHFANDVYLAMRLLEHVADATGYEVGTFTHTIFSLHVYAKDIQGVF